MGSIPVKCKVKVQLQGTTRYRKKAKDKHHKHISVRRLINSWNFLVAVIQLYPYSHSLSSVIHCCFYSQPLAEKICYSLKKKQKKQETEKLQKRNQMNKWFIEKTLTAKRKKEHGLTTKKSMTWSINLG